MLIQVNLENSI